MDVVSEEKVSVTYTRPDVEYGAGRLGPVARSGSMARHGTHSRCEAVSAHTGHDPWRESADRL